MIGFLIAFEIEKNNEKIKTLYSRVVEIHHSVVYVVADVDIPFSTSTFQCLQVSGYQLSECDGDFGVIV